MGAGAARARLMVQTIFLDSQRSKSFQTIFCFPKCLILLRGCINFLARHLLDTANGYDSVLVWAGETGYAGALQENPGDPVFLPQTLKIRELKVLPALLRPNLLGPVPRQSGKHAHDACVVTIRHRTPFRSRAKSLFIFTV